MTEQEMRDVVLQRSAILSELNRIGLRVIEGAEDQVMQWFAGKNVTADVSAGFLQLHQADGSECIPSQACTTLRKERPELFASNPRYDKISSHEDFARGTASEINKAKSEFIAKYGLSVFEKLPRTRVEAELKSAEVGPQMTRREYLSLSLKEKSRLAGIVGAAQIAVIMNRRG